jgi:hypothetical protein
MAENRSGETKTWLRQRLKPGEIVAALVVVIGLVWWNASGSGSPNPTEAEAPPVRAESIIKFKPNTFACVTRADLGEAEEHVGLGEKTKFDAMFRDLRCVLVPPNGTYKVLHVDSEVLEFTGATSGHAEGLWTYPNAVAP